MSSSEHFQVVVRCKPSPEQPLWKVCSQSNSLKAAGGEEETTEFVFTKVLEESTSHMELYEQTVAPTLSSLLDGAHTNLAVVAYGPSCGGKSHSVFGTTGQTRVRAEARGVIYRCGEQLLRELESKEFTYCVSVSFLHVFEDGRVADLFDTKKRNMEVMLDQSTLLYSVPAVTQQRVSSLQEVLRLVEKGYLIRNATGCAREPTKRTGFSSAMKPLPLQQYRPHCSHAVFNYTVQYQSPGAEEVQLLHVMVADLAGRAIDELLSSSPCSDVGLETLHRVMTTLSSTQPTAASPLYGKSSLTKLLKPSFGGNCDTIILATLPLSSPLTNKCFQLLSGSLKIKNFSKRTVISLSRSELANSDTTSAEEQSTPHSTVAQIVGGVFTERIKLKGRKPPIPVQGTTPTNVKQSPIKLVSKHEPTPPSPLFLAKRAEVKSEDADQASGDSLSLSSDSNSDSDDATPTTPVTSGPPPPPLRGIPHFNPDSPLSSQLTTTPLIPSITGRPPSAHRHTKKPTTPTKETSSESSPRSSETDMKVHTSQPLTQRATEEREKDPIKVAPLARDHPHLPIPQDHTHPPPPAGTARQTLRHKPQLPPITQVIPSQSHGSIPHMAPPNRQPPPHLHSTPTSPLSPQSSTPTPLSPPHINTPILEDNTPTPSQPPLINNTPTPSQPPLINNTPTPSQPPPISSTPTPPQSESSTIQDTPPPSTAVTIWNDKVGVAQSATAPDERGSDLRRSGGSLGDVSNTSSSVTLSSDSEDGERRDIFNTDISRRPPTMNRPPAANRYGYPRRGILPPLTPGSHPHTHHPHGRQQLPAIDPSLYPGSTRQPPPLPVYTSGTATPTGSNNEGNPPQRGVASELSNEEIHMAAMEGVKASEMKRLAVQYGIDYKDIGGRTPLMYAVLGNQPKMCEVLVKLRASLNVKDSSGLTPLLWAAFYAKPEVLRVLLKSGADPHCTDSGGRTLYHWAMRTPNFHCLKWLCKLANLPSLINKLDNEGLTALHWAVMGDQAFHIRHLLTTTDADVSIMDRECRPPLTYAVLNFSPACIRAILEVREEAVNLTDNKGRTALHYACAEGSADCVRTLLSFRSCDLHCTDNAGTTPLHWAAAANHPGLIQLLLRRGADRAQQDSNNMTPLDHAHQRNHIECIKVLQTYGLRRPSSALSIASHVSIPTHGGVTPTFDEDGHVILRHPDQTFSMSAAPAADRLPADGGEGGSLVAVGRREGDQTSRVSHSQRPGSETNRRWSALLCCGSRRNNVVTPL